MGKSNVKLWEAALLMALSICFCVAAVQGSEARRASENILRMHVVASSDQPEAQALKLRVRDAVLPVVEESLRGCDRLEEAAERIEEHREAILAAAGKAAEGERVELRLGRERFPYREAEGYALPAGEYLALRLIIGEGEGHNWWGVIFPALDLSGGHGQNFRWGENENTVLIQDEDGVEIRFRIVELFQALRLRMMI